MRTATERSSAVTAAGALPHTGDFTAGLAVYERAGCGSCHALSTTGSTGTTGPNLDEHIAMKGVGGIANVIRFGRRQMPSFLDILSEEEILDVLNETFGRYAREREPGEPFGDFNIRAGIVREVTEGRFFNG